MIYNEVRIYDFCYDRVILRNNGWFKDVYGD